VPPALAPGDAYTAQELAEVGRLAERSERVGDLVEMATAWRTKQRKVARQVAALNQKVDDLEAQVAALEGRAPTIAELRPFARRLLSGARRRTVRTLRDLKARGRAATVRVQPPR
jgi:chromosome segregation ATPase